MGSTQTYLLLGFRGWAEVGLRPLWTNYWQGKGPSVRAARPAARGLHVLSAKETGVRRGIQVDRPVSRLSHPHPPPQPQPHRQPPQQQLQSGSNIIKSNKVWLLQRTKTRNRTWKSKLSPAGQTCGLFIYCVYHSKGSGNLYLYSVPRVAGNCSVGLTQLKSSCC